MANRGKVINGLCNAIGIIHGYVPKRCWGYGEQACRDAMELLREQEAKTGKWERQYSRPGVYANLFWWCSVCKEPTRYNDAGIFYKYCPHCGAKLEPCRET